MLSCTKHVYTFLFHFLRLSCSHSSRSLRHPSLGLSNSSLTLRYRAQLFFSGRCPFFRALHLGIQFSLHPVSSLSGTQQQLTLPLWDSAKAHSPSSKKLNASSQEDAHFSGSCTLAYNFHFILRRPSLGLSNSSLTLQ